MWRLLLTKAQRNIIGWGIFIVLAILVSFLFTSPEFRPNDKLITLPFALPGLGDTINEFVAIILLSVIVIGGVISAGIPLFFVYRMLDTTASGVANDEEYKASVAALANREKEQIKALAKAQPAGKAPSHDESGWTATSSALTIGFFLALVGAAFSDNFAGGTNQANTVWLFTITGLIIGFLTLNYNRVRNSDDTQANPIDWGMIYIVLTGIIVVGLGTGVMMWVRSQVG